MKNTKVKRFDSYGDDPINRINDFIRDKELVDIKQSVVVATTGNFYTQYLIIYKEESACDTK